MIEKSEDTNPSGQRNLIQCDKERVDYQIILMIDVKSAIKS